MKSNSVGVIGLGQMGGPIAARLSTTGYEVVGFDSAGTAERVGGSVEVGSSKADVVQRCETVIFSLPNGEVCEKVAQMVAETHDRRSSAVIDLSTIGREAAQGCAQTLADAGVSYVDAPVSGGVTGATSGKLAVIASAPASEIERLRELLEAIGRPLFVVGEAPGQGQAMKLINNYIAATGLAATIEGLLYGAEVGLDEQLMVDVLNASSGRTSASQDKLPQAVLPRTYDFGHAAESMYKDVMLYFQGALKVDTPHELATTSDAIWKRFAGHHPDADFTALHKYLADGDA